MSIDRSVSYEPLAPGTGRAKTIGWWGMLLGATTLLMFQASMVAGYVYLSWRQPVWPPQGIAPPPLTQALAALVSVAAAVAATTALRAARRGRPARLPAGLAGAVVVGAGALAWRVQTYATLDLRWDDHAYGSLFWLLGGYEIAILGTGVLVMLVAVAQFVTGRLDVTSDANAEVAVVYWWFAAATSLLSTGTLHLLAYL